ncbi:MAG: hypothetical protein ACI9MJ_002202 [Alphaproteobacteria bacterium]|jgi:hypothetical protein
MTGAFSAGRTVHRVLRVAHFAPPHGALRIAWRVSCAVSSASRIASFVPRFLHRVPATRPNSMPLLNNSKPLTRLR